MIILYQHFKEDWQKWSAWWDKGQAIISEDLTRRGQKGLSQQWHFQVKQMSDLAVHSFKEMITVAAENFSQWSCEKYIWRVTMIRNVLQAIDILPWPIAKQDNWFTRLDEAPKSMIDSNGDLMKMKFIIGTLMPMGWNPIQILETNIESKDWLPFEKMNLTLAESCKVPKMRNLPEEYRLKLVPKPMEADEKQTSSSKLKVKRKTLSHSKSVEV